MKARTTSRILVVDDDHEIATMLARALTRHGFTVHTTDSAEQALKQMRAEPFDAAIVDLVMPERDGMAVAAALSAYSPGLPIAILTGFKHSPLVTDAERSRLTVLSKPFEIAEILGFLESALDLSGD
jgi:two-component system response regulator MprA